MSKPTKAQSRPSFDFLPIPPEQQGRLMAGALCAQGQPDLVLLAVSNAMRGPSTPESIGFLNAIGERLVAA